MKSMKEASGYFIVFTILIIFNLIPSLIRTAIADDQALFTVGSSYTPNVLIILDTSQKMDEDFVANLVGPYKTGSRLVEAKRAIQQIISEYIGQMNFGIMTFNLPSVSAYNLHNSPYFVTYEPVTYCPTPPADGSCTNYCITGDPAAMVACNTACGLPFNATTAIQEDQILAYYQNNPLQDPTIPDPENPPDGVITHPLLTKYCNLIYPKTQRYQNPTDIPGNFVYYAMPGTFYDPGNYGNGFCYSGGYHPVNTPPWNGWNDSGCTLTNWSSCNSYNCYSTKTGTNDNFNNYFNNDGINGQFVPTDEDVSEGFANYGQRLAWYWVGETWFANSSPGGGYLKAPIVANDANNDQLNSLTAELNMQENNMPAYMNGGCAGNNSNTCPFIINAGLSPTAGALQSAKKYFQGTYPGYQSPINASCQKNFIILVTAGLPNVNPDGSAGTTLAVMPTVTNNLDLLHSVNVTLGAHSYNTNINTYVLGMGLTTADQYWLNLMATHGGTAVNGQAYFANDTSAMITQLEGILSNIVGASYDFTQPSISASRTIDENFIYEASLDPVGSGYPFWVGKLKKWALNPDGSENSIIWEAGNVLQSGAPGNRNMQTLIGGNLVNFQPKYIDPSTPVSYTKMNVADQTTADAIISYLRGYATYQVDNSTDTAIVSANDPDNWKLGDIFHSSPVTLGTPSLLFNDNVEINPNPMYAPLKAFDEYRANHIRASTCPGGGTGCAGYGMRMVLAGANDGQYHGFNATTGKEFWSFIPPNLLPKLSYFPYAVVPPSLDAVNYTNGHNFYVDGRTTAVDAWLPAALSNGWTKNPADWHTLVMVSLGRNDRDYSADNGAFPLPYTSTKYWSSSPTCDADFVTGPNLGLMDEYDVHYPYYCGYYALDFTNAPTSSPTFMWTLQPTAAIAPFLGEPWSTISAGRVSIGGNERWVGIIGGGYNNSTAACTHHHCHDQRGKAIIVFDLRNGQTLWSYSWGHHNTSTASQNMDYAIPAQAAWVDSDGDGFIDHAYVGDMNGNMWQIKFCTKADLINNPSCDTSSWQMSLLLSALPASSNYPIYFQPTVTTDNNNNLWVFWSSGDIVNPTGNNPAAKVYGVMPSFCTDSGGNLTPCSRSGLADITNGNSNYCNNSSQYVGWSMQLTGQSEQVLAQPVAFNDVLYFTSFIPQPASSGNCTATGTAQLYAININASASSCTVGTSALPGGQPFLSVGTGIASGVLLSYNPVMNNMNAYVTVSGAGGQSGGTYKVYNPPTIPTAANMIYWRDRRTKP